jgi:hypothetical protein
MEKWKIFRGKNSLSAKSLGRQNKSLHNHDFWRVAADYVHWSFPHIPQVFPQGDPVKNLISTGICRKRAKKSPQVPKNLWRKSGLRKTKISSEFRP